METTLGGDATGDCTASRKQDSSHVLTYDQDLDYEFLKPDGSYSERTVTDDLLPTDRAQTPYRQRMTDGKLYAFAVVQGMTSLIPIGPYLASGGVGINIANMNGLFYVPDSSLLDLSYRKTFDYSFGLDHYGRSVNEAWTYPGSEFSTVDLGYLCIPYEGAKEIQIEAWDREVNNDPIGSREILVGGYGTGILYRDLGNGIAVRVEQTLTQYNSIDDTNYDAVFHNVIRVLNTDTIIAEYDFQRTVPRCYEPFLYVQMRNIVRHERIRHGDIPSPPSNYVCSPNNLDWFESLFDEDPKPAIGLGWVNKLAVDNDLNDSATFRCVSVKCYRENGTLFKTVYPEPDEQTILDGTIIDLDVQKNDYYEVAFDNVGNHTTEVTNVTFSSDLISSVDRTTETFTPYEFNYFTFTAWDQGGAAPKPTIPIGGLTCNLVFTHDQSGFIIPSAFTITLRSVTGVV